MSAEPVISATSEAPSPAEQAGSSLVGVDVRQLGWIRPLIGDYAFDFKRIAPLYAGNPASPHAWREAIARRQSHPGKAIGIARIIEAQQERRGAPRAKRPPAWAIRTRWRW